MTNAIEQTNVLESVVIGGDLSKLSPEQRLSYYKAVCSSMGLNPLTKPFDYITLNGRLTLYARKDAADQLRKLHDVSITKLERERIDTIYTVTAYVQDKTGRQDSSIGAVNIENLKGDALANAIMKAETKSKRRVTLSICGLGMLDETEIETIHEYAEEVVPQVVPSNGDMSYDEALCEPTSDGQPYGELTNAQLANRSIGIDKGLRKGDITSEKQEELIRKLTAIKVILKNDPDEKRFVKATQVG